MSASDSMSDVARRALDAHVAWICHRTRGAALRRWICETVDAGLEDARALRLREAVPQALVEETALRYAADLPMTGGIAYLVAAVGQRMRMQGAFDGLQLGHILPESALREMADKLIEMRPLHRRMVRAVLRSPAVQDHLGAMLAGALDHWGERVRTHPLRRALNRLPLAPNALGIVEERIEREWERGATRTAQALTQALERWLLQLEPEQLEALGELIIVTTRDLQIDALRPGLSDDDIDDLAALAWSFWQQMRGEPAYRDLIRAGIDAVYSELGERSLRDTLDELGITRDTLVDEAMHFAPQVLRVLRRKGLLEDIVRRQLEPFYRSDDFAAAVSGQPD